jgi:hypothetical protein
MQLRKEYRILITLNRPSPMLKNSISKLLKIRTKSISINSKVPPVIV